MSKVEPTELVLPIDEVIVNDKKWTELHLSEPSVKTINLGMRELAYRDGSPTPESTHRFFIKLISSHTGLPVEKVENLKISTVNKGGMFLANFSNQGV